jgi:hypothetical protein
MFAINGERLTFALTNEQDKHFSISASTEDEKHWELHSIDENRAKLFTNGDYPLAALKTIVEKILINQINDPDISINISQVKEDLLVMMTLKEKWVERKITLQLDSKKRATEIERLETLLAKTRRELATLKENYEQQILQLKRDIPAQPILVSVDDNRESLQKHVGYYNSGYYQAKSSPSAIDLYTTRLSKGIWMVHYMCTVHIKTTRFGSKIDFWIPFAIHYGDSIESRNGFYINREKNNSNFNVFNDEDRIESQSLDIKKYTIIHSSGEDNLYVKLFGTSDYKELDQTTEFTNIKLVLTQIQAA